LKKSARVCPPIFPHVPEYMMFLMCVDYHCRNEVGMDIPENEELIKRFENKKNLY
jgi:hypothetical protein